MKNFSLLLIIFRQLATSTSYGDNSSTVFWIILVVIVFFVIGISGVSQAKKRGETIKKTAENQEKYISEKEIRKSADYEWHDLLNQYRYRFIADDKTQTIYLSTGIGTTILDEIPYEEVIGFEVIEDSHVIGGIKRAVIGGVLAGPAGAIVGAQTAHKTAVSSLKAVLYRENTGNPTYTLELIKMKTKTTAPEYISAKTFAENLNATIKAVIAKTDHTIRLTKEKADELSSSSSDDFTEKLTKLKSAYEANLITETEYEEKKKEIMSSL